MTETIPVEAGQWRKPMIGVWAVVRPGRRKGFWIVVSSIFPYHISEVGRREIERLPLANTDYFGSEPHPGLSYHNSLNEALESREQL